MSDTEISTQLCAVKGIGQVRNFPLIFMQKKKKKEKEIYVNIYIVDSRHVFNA